MKIAFLPHENFRAYGRKFYHTIMRKKASLMFPVFAKYER